MTALRDSHILIFGASGALGAELARQLVQAGAMLSLAGRSGPALDELAAELRQLSEHCVLSVSVGELTAPEVPAAIVAAASEVHPLTGLVFAAGAVAFGPATELEDDILDDLLLINLIAPIRVVRDGAGALTRGGFIAVLSAVVAERPTPGMAGYSASKAGLSGFLAAAGVELRRKGIRVIDLRPPHTETGLATRPIAGVAPLLPTGLSTGLVAARIVQAITEEERDVPAAAFG